ncbi:hypothetical protein PDE_01117 [Penicillium oxalicum 114-2]|uniref:Uncharacterized protein n=1 Tax=Penicillium oxalicum (strain 114-2 / CGMCC 5302) TaxID=933388 RepID=S7ZBW0_PENO1|nr:hypothetical protein PDE_01117 [Penicillium oxalicum 114-2]
MRDESVVDDTKAALASYEDPYHRPRCLLISLHTPIISLRMHPRDKRHIGKVVNELCPQRVRIKMCGGTDSQRIYYETRDLGLIAVRPNESPGGACGGPRER